MAEERETYIFTKTDDVVIRNTPTDRYKLGVCPNKCGVYAVPVTKDHLHCTFCNVEGMALDKEKYLEAMEFGVSIENFKSVPNE